ncbi:MAG TPA: hypothetical protein VGS79_17450 [Puia sp.]|nr:hypothetical protein [Puia sp.]
MFNSFRAGAGPGTGRMPGRPRALALFQVILGLFFCAVLWAVAYYEFGSYFDRAHSRGCRIYRVNSYEQFMKEKAGAGVFLLA